MPSSRAFLVLMLLPLAAWSAEAGTAPGQGPPPPGRSWGETVKDRRAAVSRHLEVASDGWRWFAEASHGREAGAPFVLLRLLPDLAPDLWGEPADDWENPGEQFALFGFFSVSPEKEKTLYRSNENSPRPLPLGLGWALDPTRGQGQGPNGYAADEKRDGPALHFASLTCAACHVGRVRDETGKLSLLIGAPNNEIDVRKYRHMFELTAERLLIGPELDRTVARIGELIEKRSKGRPNAFFGGWYGIDAESEAQELAAYRDPERCRTILATFASRVGAGRLAVEKQRATSYSLPNAPPLDGGTPGQSDGSGDLIPKLLLHREADPEPYGHEIDPETEALGPLRRFLAQDYPEMPFQRATATDATSVWMQADRVVGQLDGSVKSPQIRDIAAMVAVNGNPRGLNYDVAKYTTAFHHRLPPPPFPFRVDPTRARRGEALFEANCASCHKAGDTKIYGLAEIGSDMNRARVVSNAEGRELLIRSFLMAVPEDVEWRRGLSEADVVNDRTSPNRQGYVAGPLDGVWARAPYLHNGSVPTLRHLLAPRNSESRRPEVFVRGSPEYDASSVGFAWDHRDAARLRAESPTAALFDTGWDGASNAGHDRPSVEVDGRPHRLDWSGPEHREQLEDLLEYLKTL